MARPALRIGVTIKDQKALRKLLSGGVQQVRVVLRAVALLQLAKGVSAPRVSAVVPLTPQAIRKVGHRYQQGGLERALYEKERPGAAALLEDSQRQRIIAMVCSHPPEGRARWTVRLVAEGRIIIDPDLAPALAEGLTPGKGGAKRTDTLTTREMEVLQLLAFGNTNKDIAERLSISPETVKAHLEHIFEKLQVSDRAAAVAKAFRRGLIE